LQLDLLMTLTKKFFTGNVTVFFVPSGRIGKELVLVTCPSFATILKNTYGVPIRLFITGEGEIASTEGKAQGGPLAIGYVCSSHYPLIHSLCQSHPDVSEVWYTDDATAGGQLVSLLNWWKHLLACGPIYGYFPNAAKTCLIVKPDQFDSAQTLFNGTDIQISCEGQSHLGAAIGY